MNTEIVKQRLASLIELQLQNEKRMQVLNKQAKILRKLLQIETD